MSEETKAPKTVSTSLSPIKEEGRIPKEEQLVKQVVMNQEKIDRFRKLKEKVYTLTRKVCQDMRKIKALVSKEKRRNDSCLVGVSSDDCADLELLE